MGPLLTDTERRDWLRLIRSRRVGPATFHRLLAEHGSASAALAALPGIALEAGVKDYQALPAKFAADEINTGTRLGMRLLCLPDPDYPALLKTTPDPTPVLWTLGDTALAARPAVAIVGARNASSLGTRFTRKLVEDLGEAGYAIVSGLARGIDAAAHTAALPTGTIAVQAGGLDVIYPQENTQLHADIATSGLRLSELPLGLIPQARHFPQRNRLIAGLGLATIVIEGAARSGSLITARDAAELGREVMAVPGNPMDARATGCNMLIRDGATLIRSAEDVIEALQTAAPQVDKPPVADLFAGQQPPPGDTIQARILAHLGPSAVAEDILIRDVGLPPAQITPHLTTLELDGKIQRHPGGMLALAG